MKRLEEQLEFDFMEGNRKEDMEKEREAKIFATALGGTIGLIALYSIPAYVEMARTYFNI